MIAIRKNLREEIRITQKEFRGHDLLNSRVFYRNDDGKWRPGKQGVAIRMELVPEFLGALHQVVDTAEAA